MLVKSNLLTIVGVVALTLVPANAFSQSVPPLANVTLEVISCPKDRFQAPRVEVAPATLFQKRATFSAVQSRVQNPGIGYYRLSFALAQGNYLIRSESASCSSTIQAAVMALHQRAFSIALTENGYSMVSLANAVMGVLPLTPALGYLRDSHGGKRYLDIQDRAFYLERVPPEKYSIVLEIHGGFQTILPLDASGLSTAGFIRRDIDIKEFREHLGEIYVNGSPDTSCYWCY
jgi:hypothetical protein